MEEDEENEILDCPKCGREYDEIDQDYQICHHCGYDAEKKVTRASSVSRVLTKNNFLMGMYDNLMINVDKLPLSDVDKKRLADEQFQTKSFDCTLTEIYITDEGELKINRMDEQLVTIPYHGWINFYTDCEGEWFEFNAKFTDGKLVEIERIENSLYDFAKQK